jgi:uncharacterized cupin superfamily protein
VPPVEAVNVLGGDWDPGQWPEHENYEKRRLRVGDRLGGELLGGSLYELPPGKKSFPFHWHQGIEELLVVLEGEPTLRTPDGEQRLKRGDAVSFLRGADGAHQVRNETDAPARYLMISTVVDYDVAHYPDSGKVGILSKDVRLLVRPESGVDYMDGED